MDYIKVILLVNIGLTFAYEIISEYPDEELENSNTEIEHPIEENTKDTFDNIPDEYLDKDIIHLPDNVYPKHYRVHLTVDTTSYPIIFLSGQVDINITVVPNNTIQTLLLHAKNIKLNNFYTTLSSTKGIYFVDKSYTVQEEFLAIKFLSKVLPDNYTLTAVFDSTANDSFIRKELSHEHTLFGQKNDLILTPFKKTAARQLFPCWDDPAYKTTFDIEVTHEIGYTVLSNMPVSESYDADTDQANMKCTKFITTPMMSTHQLVILLKPFNLIVDPTETVYTWHKSDITPIISFIHSTVNNISKLLLEYTKTPLDNQKIDHVLVPNAPYSKSQLGLIIYRESDVIYDENKDPLDVKREVMSMIESQIARQWFGGLVTPKFWNDSWLTESFALYFSHYLPKAELWENIDLCKDYARFDKAKQLKIIQKYQDLLHKDVGSMPPVLSEILSLKPTSDVYHKGAFILRMLSGIISEQNFRKTVIEYLNRHKYGLVTSDDLWSILQDVESVNGLRDNFLDYRYDFNRAPYDISIHTLYKQQLHIKEVIEPWITQKGFPIVSVYVWQTNNRITCTQVSSSGDGSKWWIPVTYIMKNDHPVCNPIFWIKPGRDLDIEENWTNNWIIINIRQTGYYRVRYDRKNWENLGDFLNNDNYSRIPVINRAQLIDDICDEYRNKRTDWDLFSLITSYLSRETDYISWVPMFKCLDMLAEFFQLPESKWFQTYIGNYFTFILNEVGYEKNDDDDNDDDDDDYYDDYEEDDDDKKKARQNLAFYACTLGNPTCRSAAADKLKKYLANPTIYKISPWWKNWTFCFGLKTENVSIWEQVYQLYAETKEKTILNSLPCTEDPNIIIKFLHTIVENNTLIEEADQANLFNIIIKQHIGDNQIFSHIKDNIQILKPKSISLTDAFDTIITNIYSEEQLDKLYGLIMTAIDDSNEYKAKQNIIGRQREKIGVLREKIDMMFPNKTIYYM